MAYNPGISFQGDRYLFEGLARAGQSIADGARQYGMNRRREKEEQEALDSFLRFSGLESNGNSGGVSGMFGGGSIPSLKPPQNPFSAQAKTAKAYDTLLETDHGINKDMLATMSLGEKRGMIRAMEYKRMQEEEQRKALQSTQRFLLDEQKFEHEKKMGDAKLADMQRQRGAQDDFRAMYAAQSDPAIAGIANYLQGGLTPDQLSNIMEMGNSLPRQQEPMDARKIMEIGALTGAMSPKDLVASVARFEKMAANPLDYAPRETTVAGKHVIYNPKSGNFSFTEKEKKPGIDDIAKVRLQGLQSELSAINRGLTDPRANPDQNTEWKRRKKELQTQIDALLKEQGGKTSPAATDADKLLAEANAAIKQGADPAKVKARLKERGIEVN